MVGRRPYGDRAQPNPGSTYESPVPHCREWADLLGAVHDCGGHREEARTDRQTLGRLPGSTDRRHEFRLPLRWISRRLLSLELGPDAGPVGPCAAWLAPDGEVGRRAPGLGGRARPDALRLDRARA